MDGAQCNLKKRKMETEEEKQESDWECKGMFGPLLDTNERGGQDWKWKLLVPVSLAAAGDKHKNGDWKKTLHGWKIEKIMRGKESK